MQRDIIDVLLSWFAERRHRGTVKLQHLFIIRRNRVKANLQIALVRAWVGAWVGAWVCAWVRACVTVYLGNRLTYFPEILHKIRKKKENFAQGPIFDKKCLELIKN